MRHRHRLVCASIVAWSLAAPATSRAATAPISDVVLPGGIAAARGVLRDRAPVERALFVVELVERFYNTPKTPAENEYPELQALLSHLQRESVALGASDVVPLPLTTEWWTDAVFGGRTTPATLLLDILWSRDAALLYRALLAVDPPTRLWLAEHPEVLRGRADRLVAAAPGMRIREGRLLLPGGERARGAWEALVGTGTSEPAAFLARVLSEGEGTLAYFYGRMGRLTERQVAAAFGLDSDDRAERAEQGGRLYRVFRRAAGKWNPRARPFSAMPQDPSLLLSELEIDRDGRHRVPGTRRFWRTVFDARGTPSTLSIPSDAPTDDPPLDLAWLAEQVFVVDPGECRVRAEQVLFASRMHARAAWAAGSDTAVVLAALRRYPALVRTLERVAIDDLPTYLSAIRRAGALEDIPDPSAEIRSTTQYQGAVALLTRAASRGSLSARSAADLVSSLSDVATDGTGEYGGGIVRWLEEHLWRRVAQAREGRSPAVESDLVLLLTNGLAPHSPARLEWEGVVYRLDLAHADLRRIERVRGHRPPRYLSAAFAARRAADRLKGAATAPSDLSHEADALEALASGAGHRADLAQDGDALPATAAGLAATLRRAATLGQAPADRTAPDLRRLADELAARGLAELTYAAALGGSDTVPLTAGEAASRHEFGQGLTDTSGALQAWRLPVRSARTRGPWHVEGALLALDVCLAETWLTRRSQRPLQEPPTMDRIDQRALGQSVVVMDASALTDADRDLIVAALHAGRSRLAAVASEDALDAVAGAMSLATTRRSVLPWMYARDRDRVASFFSIAELFRLGTAEPGATLSLDAWGAPARPRLGCLCLQFPDRAADAYAGHLSSGILMGAVPDLNLRLAEWLAALAMPAALLPSVLAAATHDLVTRTPVRYPDDLRSVTEQVKAVTRDDVEQYLALLTTDGPLVPVRGGATGAARGEP
jgi:hypothetical protein